MEQTYFSVNCLTRVFQFALHYLGRLHHGMLRFLSMSTSLLFNKVVGLVLFKSSVELKCDVFPLYLFLATAHAPLGIEPTIPYSSGKRKAYYVLQLDLY